MTNFSYTNFYNPYSKQAANMRFTDKSIEVKTKKEETTTEKIETSNTNTNLTPASTLEYQITLAEDKLKSQIELYQKIANAFGDVIDTNGTIGRKSGIVQLSSMNRTQKVLEKFNTILNKKVTDKTVEKLKERLEALENALNEINIEIDDRMKHIGTKNVLNTIYADGLKQYNIKTTHS